MIVTIPISTIDAGDIDNHLKGKSLEETKRHTARVNSLVKAYAEGEKVPLITCFEVFGKRFLAGGRHRLRAHQVLGRKEIVTDLILVRSLEEFRIEKAFFIWRQQHEAYWGKHS